jgi:hypothetical protein
VARPQAEEARIEGQIASYQGRVESAPSKDQELATLTRDYEATKVLYQSLLQRDEDARMADNLEKKRIEEEIRVLDPAVPARLPAAPNRWMLLGLGLVVSMGLVLFVVVVVEHWDTSFHSVDGIRMFTKVPVLASIPVIDVSSRYARWGKAGFAAIASAVGITCIIALAWLVAHENVQLVTLLSRGGS